MNTIAYNQAFITAAYAVTWVVILGYLVRLILVARRVRETQEKP